MQRRIYTGGVAVLIVGILGFSTLMAAPKTYQYRCPRCQLIETYAQPGIKKCPKDGWTMVKVN